LKETNEVFEAIPKFLEEFDEPESEMTKYVVGTIGRLDTPMNPHAKGLRDFALYYAGITFEELKKSRDEVILVSAKDIRKLAPYVSKMLEANNICVIGNETKIEQNKDMFKEVKTLA
jgi:Zn-dependent M16 (insulinase) family peptidase